MKAFPEGGCFWNNLCSGAFEPGGDVHLETVPALWWICCAHALGNLLEVNQLWLFANESAAQDHQAYQVAVASASRLTSSFGWFGWLIVLFACHAK